MLMPDHLHLVAAVRDPVAAHDGLRRALCGAPRGTGGLWSPIPAPIVLESRSRIRREVRYVTLNPCRKGLTDDPLAWRWTTHRDVVGAAVDPWVTTGLLVSQLEWRGPAGRFAESWHRYVSRDRHVDPDGTPLPVAAPPRAVIARSLDDVALAVRAATRSGPCAVRRRGPVRDLFVALAAEQAWRDARAVAAACGLTAHAVRRSRRRPRPAGIEAAALCLGDTRLLKPPA